MATETQNGVELRNSVDNTAAEAGLKRLEEAASTTSQRIADNAARAAEKQVAAEERSRSEAETRAKKATSMALAFGTGGADIAGQALSLAGYEETGKALSGAADGARKLGTMLAPLGPAAAAAGAGVGALAGGLKSLADSAIRERRKLEAAAQSARDMAADQALDREDMERLKREDPDAAARKQHEAQETLRRAAVRSEMGARVDLDALAPLAAFDPEAVKEIFVKQRLLGNEGGDRAKAVFAAMDYDETRADYEGAAAARDAATGFWNVRTRTVMSNRAAEYKAKLDLAESVPDVLAAFQGRGGGWDAGLAARWDEMEKSRLAGLRGDGADEPETIADVPERGSLSAPKADSLSAQGIGYTGNPMQKTEELLREIRDDARTNAKRAATEPLLG